jgi:hypothetical protein
MRAIRCQVANPADGSIFFQQLSHIGVHHKPERRVFSRLARDEFEKPHLRNKQDVRESRLKPAQIKRPEVAVGKLDRRPGNLGMGNFVEFVRQPNLVEDFQGRGMDGVAAEFAVEVLVHFQQCHGNAAASEE